MPRTSTSSTSPTRSNDGRTTPLLCAYSPRWLSGPTPGYEGLCPTWASDDPETAEHEAISVS
jgi:hypothetical protein